MTTRSQSQHFTTSSRVRRLRAYNPSHPDFGISVTLIADPGLEAEITDVRSDTVLGAASSEDLFLEGLSSGKGLYANTIEVG